MTPLLGSGAPAQRKGGCRSASDFVSHLIAFDSHRWRCAQKDTAGWISDRVVLPKGNLSAIPHALSRSREALSPVGP